MHPRVTAAERDPKHGTFVPRGTSSKNRAVREHSCAFPTPPRHMEIMGYMYASRVGGSQVVHKEKKRSDWGKKLFLKIFSLGVFAFKDFLQLTSISDLPPPPGLQLLMRTRDCSESEIKATGQQRLGGCPQDHPFRTYSVDSSASTFPPSRCGRVGSRRLGHVVDPSYSSPSHHGPLFDPSSCPFFPLLILSSYCTEPTDYSSHLSPRPSFSALLPPFTHPSQRPPPHRLPPAAAAAVSN
ncbi:hypothetical protein HDK90DRAFT_487101 [Phyllosticta capitalensis]|uniref:Uncharacterized protein n=1 Tax=Phyllosticta capitalensis TaxID=121624 RepID=A0ABR1YMZ8_9PEZI